MNENSLDVYFNDIAPTMTRREKDVMNAIFTIEPCTMHEVANHMGVQLNTISGRFSALVRKSKLVVVGRQDKKSLYKTT